jgi:hypothetical protein
LCRSCMPSFLFSAFLVFFSLRFIKPKPKNSVMLVPWWRAIRLSCAKTITDSFPSMFSVVVVLCFVFLWFSRLWSVLCLCLCLCSLAQNEKEFLLFKSDQSLQVLLLLLLLCCFLRSACCFCFILSSLHSLSLCLLFPFVS